MKRVFFQRNRNASNKLILPIKPKNLIKPKLYTPKKLGENLINKSKKEK